MESCNNNIHAASDGAQYKKVRVRVLGRGTRLKNKLQSPLQADRHRKPTNAVAKRLGRQMGAAHRKYTRSRIGKASAVMRQLHRSVVLKRELCTKAKLSILKSVLLSMFLFLLKAMSVESMRK